MQNKEIDVEYVVKVVLYNRSIGFLIRQNGLTFSSSYNYMVGILNLRLVRDRLVQLQPHLSPLGLLCIAQATVACPWYSLSTQAHGYAASQDSMTIA